jgi:hypothetical protein
MQGFCAGLEDQYCVLACFYSKEAAILRKSLIRILFHTSSHLSTQTPFLHASRISSWARLRTNKERCFVCQKEPLPPKLLNKIKQNRGRLGSQGIITEMGVNDGHIRYSLCVAAQLTRNFHILQQYIRRYSTMSRTVSCTESQLFEYKDE